MTGNYTKAIILAVTMRIASLACGGIIGEPTPAAYESTCSSITHGSIDTGHPEVGIILSEAGGCTGTLIAWNVVLTARHCVQPGEKYSFTLDDGRCFDSFSVIQHPRHDIALVTLDIPAVPGEREGAFIEVRSDDMPIAQLSMTPPELGQAITIVGYGNTDDGGGWGTKRSGSNTISELNGNHGFSWVGHCGLCFGDSGGASYNAAGDVIGVHSTGTCGDHSTDVRVDVHLKWIASVVQK